MLEAGADALVSLLQLNSLAFLVLGVCVGLCVGLIPGLGGVVGMSILLPFVFGMEVHTAIPMLIGMMSVTTTVDTFPSVLLGVPGTAGSQATIMDGYPLAQQGEARRALGAAFFVSMIGGLFGAVFMFGGISLVRPVVLALGSPELFMLVVLGLSMVGVMSRGTPITGLLAAVVGLMLGTVGGAAGTAQYRFNFDSLYLFDGIPLSVLAIGLFAIPEMIDLVVAKRRVSKTGAMAGRLIDGIRDALRSKRLIFQSAGIGSFIGMLPGIGGPAIDWISYGVAKQTVRDSSRFGKGDIRGVIAPESANNAKEGGALLPTLMFGIPGTGSTAILLGGLLIFGIRPGPAMITDNMDVTLTIVWTLVLANVVGTMACLGLSKWIAKVSMIPATTLVPFLLVVLVLASYQSSNHWGDIFVLFGFGALGWVMKQVGWPRAPLLIGFVLSGPAEQYLFISYSRYGWEWLAFPYVIAIGAVTLFLTLLMSFLQMRLTRRQRATEAEDIRTETLESTKDQRHE
jgi:putative tricarboxylic transport membrane protein